VTVRVGTLFFLGLFLGFDQTKKLFLDDFDFNAIVVQSDCLVPGGLRIILLGYIHREN
jgi:hypothetical protein